MDYDDKLRFLRVMKTIVICATIAAAGCKSRDERMSHLRHDLGRPVPSDVGLYQVAISDAEIVAAVSRQNSPGNGKRLLPSDDRLTRRAQHWINQIDAYLRAEYVEALALVPSPVAAVFVDSKTPNAWVTGVGVCFKLAAPALFGPATSSAQSANDVMAKGKNISINPVA